MKKYEAIVLVALLSMVSASTLGDENVPRVCVCNRILMPVCGTDGITYSNDCVLECTAKQGTSRLGTELRVAYDGMCEPNEEVNNN